MQLKRLFIIRNGQATWGSNLSAQGVEQALRIGTLLRDNFFVGRTAKIICSNEYRSRMTADIIAREIGHHSDMPIGFKALFSSERYCDPAAALKLIKEYAWRTETLIVVSHEQLVAQLPPLIGQRLLSATRFPSPNAAYAEGCAIDFQTKAYNLIRSAA